MLLILFAIAYLEGKREAVMYRYGFKPPDENTFLKYFSKLYHVPTAASWLLICTLSGHWYLFFGFCQVQDMSYFIGNAYDQMDSKEWSTGGWGGFYPFGQFVPWSYFILWGLTGVWFAIHKLIEPTILKTILTLIK